MLIPPCPKIRRDGEGFFFASSAFWGPNSRDFSFFRAILPSPLPQKMPLGCFKEAVFEDAAPRFLTARTQFCIVESRQSRHTPTLFTIARLRYSLKLPSLLKYGYICKHYLPIVTSFSALLDSVTSICHLAAPARHIIHVSIIVIKMWHVSRTPASAAPHLHAVTQVTNP